MSSYGSPSSEHPLCLLSGSLSDESFCARLMRRGTRVINHSNAYSSFCVSIRRLARRKPLAFAVDAGSYASRTLTACRKRYLCGIATLVPGASSSGNWQASGYCPESFIIPDASPSQMKLLFEPFSVRASAPKPVSLAAFHQASDSTSDVSLLE